jgi:hypothetical protein
MPNEKGDCMKTDRAKLFGIIALVAMMGFTFIACNKGGSASGDKKESVSASSEKVKTNPESDFEARPIDGGKSVEITDYIGDKWEVGIPSKIRDLPVTHIRARSFQEKNLTKVTIPNSVTIIGAMAFESNQLASITIPNSITTIEGGAFISNRLTSVTIPNSVTNIEDWAFGENQLTSVAIPNSVTKIGPYAFGNNQLTSVTIGANVDLGWEMAFTGRKRDTDVSIGFEEAYNNNGKAAGTYTRPDTDSTTWTKQ